MKQIIKNVLSVALAGAAILSVACSEWTEPEIKVIQRRPTVGTVQATMLLAGGRASVFQKDSENDGLGFYK